MPKPEKIKQVEELRDKITRAKSLFLTDYTGLKVADLTHLRRQFRKSGAEFKVAKNTLIRRALEGTVYSEISQELVGQTGVGFAYDDPTLPTKVLHDFFKRIEKPKVKLFYVEKKRYAGPQLAQIAGLPSREVLLSQVLTNIQAPLANLVGTLDSMLGNLVRTIEGIGEKKEKQTAIS